MSISENDITTLQDLQVLTVDITKCTGIEFNGNKFKVSKRYVRYCPFLNRLFESDEIETLKITECERVM